MKTINIILMILSALFVSLITLGWTYAMFLMAVGMQAPDGFLWFMVAFFSVLYCPLAVMVYRSIKDE